MSNISDENANSTQVAELNDFPAEVLDHLLGPLPAKPPNPAFRAVRGWLWPRDKTGLEYFHRFLTRLLSEQGGTDKVAQSIRGDLEDGRVLAVVIDDYSGHEYEIEKRLWMAAASSADMYWHGRASVTATTGPHLGRLEGDIYLREAPTVTADAEPAKPLDLSKSTALCKLLLHLVGKKSAAQIASNSVGTDYAVPARTVSDLLNKARGRLAENAK